MLGTGLYVGKRIYDKRQARQRELDARLVERRRNLPQETRTELEKEARDSERRLAETYNTLRLSNQSIVNLTGKNVDDLLKNLQGLNPRALESYFQSLREGRGEIEQLSQTQLAHIDLIEKLVVTYRALAAESGAARDAASEYADHLRPVDVIFETLAVHAGELTSQFVEQRGALQRQTQATEAQAQAARNAAAATTAQAVATERANTGEVARIQHLLRTTQHTRKATEQVSDATERLTEFTGALVTTDAGLATHSEHVGYVTEAYRELSEQVGATVGDVLAGAGSFKEAWEALGRGVLDIVKHLGRQLLDSLLGSVRDVGRRLADVIFGQVHGTLGSFGFGASRGFLPSVLGGSSLGGFPIGLPTYPGGGGIFNGGFTGLDFPGTGGSLLWNVGAASVARVLPFTAPTLASYGFVANPIGLGTGVGGGVPGVNAPPAAGFGPFSPAALGALGGLGGSYGGNALLGAFGYRPGLASTVGGFAGGIAGSFATPVLTALLGPALGPLAPIVGPLFGTFFGTALGGLFGLQPTRIDTEKRGLRQFFRDQIPGYDYQRKESRVAAGLGAARAAGLDVEDAYLVAGLPYTLAANDAGLGTLTRFRNIGVGGLGRSGASRETARREALRLARKTGVDTTKGAIRSLNRALGGGFDRDRFTVAEVLENRDENAGETRHSRNRPVRLRHVVAGIIDIQTQFADFVDSGRLAAKILADETAQALTAAGRDASDYADVLDRIRDGSTHAAEGLREIGGLDFKNLTFTAEELDAHLLRIKDDVEAIQGAATQALTSGLSEGKSRAEVEESFQSGLQESLRRNVVKRTIDEALGDLGSIFEDIDLTEPLDAGSEAALRLKDKVGDAYDLVIDTLRAADLLPDSFDAAIDAADKIGQSVHRIAEHNRDLAQTQQLEAVGVLDPGTSQQRNLNFLQSEVATLDALTNDTPAREIRHAMTLLDQLAAATVEYYRTALAQEQQRAAAFAAAGDSLDQQIQSLIGGPGGYRPTERLAFLQDREREIRTKLKDATGVERATYLQQLGTNLTAQAQLPIYSPGDPRHIARRDAAIAELESLRREADSLRAQSEEKLLDLQEATKSELERIHALQDAYFAASLGKLDALVDNTARDYSPPTDQPRIAQEQRLPDGSTTDFPGRSAPPDGDSASESSRSQSGPTDRPAPAVTINVTLPESPESSDAAAAYARAFVAELERQLQPGARGYELVHTITRESGAR